MKAGVVVEAPAHGPAGGHAHVHAHDHAAGHDHHHGHGHDAAAHAHAPSLLLPTPAPAPVASLLMSSALLRLAGAVGLSALLWATVAWALSGTP